ncbi:MAG: phosphoenolpyruvate synthase, partial [Proteobacteria bacterium]|nr:phosphoenolpyruvate synthase [Pseudomonadota bacterium]
MNSYLIWFENLGMGDVGKVGGKNASLGEMISQLSAKGVSVPGGFATTADAYREFLAHGGLDARIKDRLAPLDIEDVTALAAAGAQIRQWIIDTPFPRKLAEAITEAYQRLESRIGHTPVVAVRSSATAEDLPEASFAGQQETFLNVRGVDAVLTAIKHVFASLYNDRAISYRVHHQFDHSDVALSAGIQQMVRSDIGASGVVFTLDTESGFPDVVFITAAYGLGETVVQGAVNPDEFYVHKATLAQGRPAILRRNLGAKAIKMLYSEDRAHGRTTHTVDVPEADRLRFCLTDSQVQDLARQAVIIEKHYGRPMDIEWACDGEDGKLYILQARPETVKSRASGQVMERYLLQERGEVLATGRSIGQRIGSGRARVIT